MKLQMTLEQLRIFCGGGRKAPHDASGGGSQCHAICGFRRSPGALTRLGPKLFDRVGHHIELTEAGRVFLPQAKAVPAQLARAAWLPRHITRFKKSILKLKSLSSSAMPQAFQRHAKDALADARLSNTKRNTAYSNGARGSAILPW
jgi:hypothetical protein